MLEDHIFLLRRLLLVRQRLLLRIRSCLTVLGRVRALLLLGVRVLLRLIILKATEIPNLCIVLPEHENIQRLQISMYDIFAMKILHSKAAVDEYFPDKIVDERLDDFATSSLPLPLDHSVQITNGTVLQDNMYFLVIDKGVDVSDDIRRVQATHYFNLVERLDSHFLWHLRHVDHLDDVVLVLQEVAALSVRAIAAHRLLDALFQLLRFCVLHALRAHGHSLAARIAYLRRGQALDLVDLPERATPELLDFLEHGPVALDWLGRFVAVRTRMPKMLIILVGIGIHFFKLYFALIITLS